MSTTSCFSSTQKTTLTRQCRRALMYDACKSAMTRDEAAAYEMLDSSTRLRHYGTMEIALALWLAIPEARRRAMRQDANRNAMVNLNAADRGERERADTNRGRCENPPANACVVLYFTDADGTLYHRPFVHRGAAGFMVEAIHALGRTAWVEEIHRAAPIEQGTATLTAAEKRKLRARRARAQAEEQREEDAAA